MKIFKLPDLGEGLPDAIVREWFVKVGDEIKEDQPMVAMETAKALVDVPAPFSGKVEKLFGAVGDTIDTGQPLVGFIGENDVARDEDAGTVVGNLQTNAGTLQESAAGVVTATRTTTGIKATPAVRMLARQLQVDLSKITPAGEHITAEEVKRAAQMTPVASTVHLTGEVTQLSGVRRAMAQSMSQAHREVASASLMDEADLYAWKEKQDITLRFLRAIVSACQAVPIVNCYYDHSRMGYQLNEKINIGIAVDTEHGLFVPVLKNVANRSDAELRQEINRFKTAAQSRSIPAEDLKGATILMSNVGAIAGQYAAPIVTPPMVAIVAFGRIKQTLVLENDKAVAHPMLPISLTFDHRPVTGGDAARFLQALIKALELPAVSLGQLPCGD